MTDEEIAELRVAAERTVRTRDAGQLVVAPNAILTLIYDYEHTLARLASAEAALKPFIPHNASDFIPGEASIVLHMIVDGAEHMMPAFQWNHLHAARAHFEKYRLAVD